MKVEEILQLNTTKKREIAYYRAVFESFENMSRIVEQNERIISLLEKLSERS